MRDRRPSPLEAIASVCFQLLLAAGALYVAVRLIEVIAVPLAIIATVAVLLIAVARIMRRIRGGGW